MATQRHIGKVTAASASGGALGAALAEIIVWAAHQYNLNMDPIAGALTVVLTAATAVIGGFLVPAENKGRHEA